MTEDITMHTTNEQSSLWETTEAQSSIEPVALIARRAHKKSRTGCRSCKERKVKCQEERPHCSNCVRHFYQPAIHCFYEDVPQRAKPVRKERRKSYPASEEALLKACNVYASRSQFLASSSIGDERLDPFETHPPSQEVDVDHLMKHYFSSLVFNMFPYYPSPGKNPQTEYYAPLIWTDPILFNVTLQLSAFHLEKLYGRGNEQSTRLQAESIRLLRERVENNPETCSCDQTISAVAGLTAIEHAKGNMRMVQMHMDGLNRMIIVRGGLNAIRKSNAMVANIVFCMFIAADEAFPTLDLESQQETPGWYLESLPLVEQREYLDLEDCGVASEFASVMKGIRLLAQCYQTADDTDSAEHYLSVLSFLCSSMQRIVSLPPPQSEDVDVYHVTEACRSAMVVHVFSQWCGHQPDPSIMVSAAQHNLKSHLKQLLGPGANNPLFLWLLSAGAVAAVGAPERAWFVGHLAAIVDDLGIQSWVEIRDQLKRVIWHEHQDEDSHKRVWEDLEALERQS